MAAGRSWAKRRVEHELRRLGRRLAGFGQKLKETLLKAFETRVVSSQEFTPTANFAQIRADVADV